MKSFGLVIMLLGLLVIALPARASHIVGGEFELVHIEGYRYRLSLILYSDDINIVDPAAIDPTAMVYIWSKTTNSRIRSINLPRVSHVRIPYTNPDCAIPQLKTSKVVYSAEITLSPDIYNEPGGYYVNYERCCRNGVINNITEPGATGEAFYLEFPPVVKDNAPFVNSSPALFPPLSDFARLGYPFFFDFRGSDADGDSLVYSLVTPLAGYSSPDSGFVVPPPHPAPYPTVNWAPGYSETNMVPGTPPLRISKGGIIEVTPSQTGLFVFSVMVEEYRNGKKIGEVRRDFQMLVYDYEGSDFPPVLTAQKPGSDRIYKDEITLTAADFNTSTETGRCINLLVSDQDVDAPGAPLNGTENLKFKISPVNFSQASSEEYLSITTGTVDKTNRTLSFNLCLPLCPPATAGPYIFNVIAYDDACAVPLTDTLRVTVDLMEGPRNMPPQTSSSLSAAQADMVNIFRTLGESFNFQVKGTDPDNDPLTMRAAGDGFNLEDYGMEFSPRSGSGPLNSTFSWKADCDNVNLAEKNFFTVFFITEDEDICQRASADTLAVNIGISAPRNAAPLLQLQGEAQQLTETTADSALVFELTALDPDTEDFLYLTLDSISADTTYSRLAYTWNDVSGKNEVSGLLQIDPDCSLFQNGETEYQATFHFRVTDNPCFTSLSDTLNIKVFIKDRQVNLGPIKFINVFTPNNDSVNDYFQILNLPKDGCFNKFEDVTVFNRWGRIVFQSTDPGFRWSGEDYPTGSYYYQLRYSDKVVRNNLMIIRGDKIPRSGSSNN